MTHRVGVLPDGASGVGATDAPPDDQVFACNANAWSRALFEPARAYAKNPRLPVGRFEPPTRCWDRVQLLAQAMGIVSVQAYCSLDTALDLMNMRARAIRLQVYDIAEAVVDGSIGFG